MTAMLEAATTLDDVVLSATAARRDREHPPAHLVAETGRPGSGHWLVDPFHRYDWRYWDGKRWTALVHGPDGPATDRPDRRPRLRRLEDGVVAAVAGSAALLMLAGIVLAALLAPHGAALAP